MPSEQDSQPKPAKRARTSFTAEQLQVGSGTGGPGGAVPPQPHPEPLSPLSAGHAGTVCSGQQPRRTNAPEAGGHDGAEPESDSGEGRDGQGGSSSPEQGGKGAPEGWHSQGSQPRGSSPRPCSIQQQLPSFTPAAMPAPLFLCLARGFSVCFSLLRCNESKAQQPQPSAINHWVGKPALAQGPGALCSVPAADRECGSFPGSRPCHQQEKLSSARKHWD